MEFERAQVDYTKLVPVYKNRALTGMKGWRYFPYAVEILALRKLGVKHRAIADWLNTIVVADIPVTNQALSSYLSLWKNGKLLDSITRKDIDDAVKKIQDESRASKNFVASPSNHAPTFVVESAPFPNKWTDIESRKIDEVPQKEKENDADFDEFS